MWNCQTHTSSASSKCIYWRIQIQQNQHTRECLLKPVLRGAVACYLPIACIRDRFLRHSVVVLIYHPWKCSIMSPGLCIAFQGVAEKTKFTKNYLLFCLHLLSMLRRNTITSEEYRFHGIQIHALSAKVLHLSLYPSLLFRIKYNYMEPKIFIFLCYIKFKGLKSQTTNTALLSLGPVCMSRRSNEASL